MEPFKRRKIILFSLIIFLLTGALLVSLHFTVANYNRCEDAKERLEENRVQLTKQQQKIDDLLSQIAAYAADGDANREDLDELLSALNVALEEKTKLELCF